VQGETIHCTTNQQRSLKDGTVNNTSNDYMVSRTHRFHQSKQRILLIRRKRYQVVFFGLDGDETHKDTQESKKYGGKDCWYKNSTLEAESTCGQSDCCQQMAGWEPRDTK
jgi:hypothetical protein